MSDELEGKTIPDFDLELFDGDQLRRISGFKGQWTLLYVYPKDDTPGCTKQACCYRDAREDFKLSGLVVMGVSMDDIASHTAFMDKFHLNFPLISDPQHQLTEFLGCYGDIEWQGKMFKSLSRDSFLVDPEGVVRKVWRKVDPSTTVAETLAEARRIKAMN